MKIRVRAKLGEWSSVVGIPVILHSEDGQHRGQLALFATPVLTKEQQIDLKQQIANAINVCGGLEMDFEV